MFGRDRRRAQTTASACRADQTEPASTSFANEAARSSSGTSNSTVALARKPCAVIAAICATCAMPARPAAAMLNMAGWLALAYSPSSPASRWHSPCPEMIALQRWITDASGPSRPVPWLSSRGAGFPRGVQLTRCAADSVRLHNTRQSLSLPHAGSPASLWAAVRPWRLPRRGRPERTVGTGVVSIYETGHYHI